LSPRCACLRIDTDPFHRPEIGDQRVIGNRQTRKAMAAAPDGELHSRAARELDCSDHVCDPGAARDQRRAAAERAGSDSPLLVVGRVVRTQQLAAERALELEECGLVELVLRRDRHSTSRKIANRGPNVYAPWHGLCMSSSARQARKAEAFGALHAGDPFVIPNPWDAGSARVLAALGFQALATTSSGFAFTL